MSGSVLDREELRQIIAEVLDVDPGDVRDGVRFVADLGVDSLLSLEILVVLEKRYEVGLSEEDLALMGTLDAAYRVLRAKLAA
ncbi:hypothetical protein GCM10029964_083540 [Kibdelosporangium lantanae]